MAFQRNFAFVNLYTADFSGRAVYGRSLVGIAGSNHAGGMDVCLCWVLCCQVQVSTTGWSLVQRSPTECDASLCVCVAETSKMRRPRPAPKGWGKLMYDSHINTDWSERYKHNLWFSPKSEHLRISVSTIPHVTAVLLQKVQEQEWPLYK